MKKIFTTLQSRIHSMNPISRKVVKYGFLFFLLIIFSCLVAIILNRYIFNYNYQIATKSLEVFKSSFSVLGITLIGGLAMDYISKRA